MYSTTTKVELKLAFQRSDARKLAAHPLLKGGGRAVVGRRHAVYYDTPSLDLRRSGVVLGVLRAGRRWWQSARGDGSVRGALHGWTEFESELNAPEPDPARIAADAFGGVFASPQVRAHLSPVFIADFTRSNRTLELGEGTTVVASIDSGVLRAGGRTEALNELELELKTGNPVRLYEVALALLRDVGLAGENRSRAERGYALMRDERAAPVKARPPALSGDMTVGEAFAAVVWASLAHMQANERGVLEGSDPEYLHQLRVASRRLRSAFNVFAPAFPAAALDARVAGLKWLGALLAPARDWDVFLAETLPPVREEFGEHAALSAFAEQCRALRIAAARRARRAVGSRRYQRQMLGLACWFASEPWAAHSEAAGRDRLQAPIPDFAGGVLDERYRRVRKRGRRLAGLSPAELHRLRIAIKKLRYATDFFSGLYEGRRARDTLKHLARLQDILGAINDASTVGTLVQEVLRGANNRNAAEARGILLGWSRGQAATLRRELSAEWKSFRAAERFWRS